MPVFFSFGEREASVTEDEARKIAERLPPDLLRDEILSRVDGRSSGPILLDLGGNEARLAALRSAIDSLEDEEDLSQSVKLLRKRAADASEDL